LLEGNNVTIREKDQAILCKKCISGQQRRDSIALATRPGVVR
jgi:hypothetical protein